MNSNLAKVVIPLYKSHITDSEMFSIENTCKILSNWPIEFIAPLHLRGFLDDFVVSKRLNVNVRYFYNKWFGSISEYNNMMLSKTFYSNYLEYEYLLIVQADAIVISDQLKDWCDKGYSYVGAPWFVGLNQPNKPLMFLGVGNGGFSLRRVEHFINVLSRIRYIPNKLDVTRNSLSRRFLSFIKNEIIFSYNVYPLLPVANEDYFWGMLVPKKIQYFNVPTPQLAAEFAFEVEPRYLFRMLDNKLPFGCHAWEKYDLEFWCERLAIPDKLLAKQISEH